MRMAKGVHLASQLNELLHPLSIFETKCGIQVLQYKKSKELVSWGWNARLEGEEDSSVFRNWITNQYLCN